MNVLNLTQAAKVSGVSRTTIYKKIKNGVLSSTLDHDGNRTVQVSELLRVFGALKGSMSTSTSTATYTAQGFDGMNVHSGESNLVGVLKDQVAMLKDQVSYLTEQVSRLTGILETRLIQYQQPPPVGQPQPSKKANESKKRKK